MILQIIGAFVLGLLVWLLGSVFDTSPKNERARVIGLVVFALLVLIILVNHYGGSSRVN